MDFYSGVDIKNTIEKKLEKKLSEYSSQRESDEYKNIDNLLHLVQKFDFEPVENIMQHDRNAFCWFNSSGGNIYINIKNKKGYRYALKNNKLGKVEE